jgi:hypothetical protein
MEEEAHTLVWAHSLVEGALGGALMHFLEERCTHFMRELCEGVSSC